MSDQTTETHNLVQGFQEQSNVYWKQFHVWLGLGSASGAVLFFTFAGQTANPNYSVQFFLLSFWSFLFGVTTAAAALLCLAKRASAKANHFSCAHNRDQLHAQIENTPEIFSSPRNIADKMNASRNRMISDRDVWHNRAERAWKMQRVWMCLWVIFLLCSCIGLVFGFAWPLWQVSFMESGVAPG